jgi:hypothetical protein
MSTSNERIIIGESGIAGLPISAPLQPECHDAVPEIKLRWRKTSTYFVLELWKLNVVNETSGWVEIPCVEL